MATLQEMQRKVDEANKASLAASEVLGTTYKAGTIATFFPGYKEPTSSSVGTSTQNNSTPTPTYQTPTYQAPTYKKTDYERQQEEANAKRLEAERIERQRQDAVKLEGIKISSAGGGTTAINEYYSKLSEADQQLVKPLFGSNIIQGYQSSLGGVQQTTVSAGGVQRQTGVLTPQQQTEYFATQGQSANPLSPTDWLKSQTVINKDSISKMPSVVDAPAPSTGTTPELPIPQVGNIQDAFGVSLQSKVDTARTTLENTYKTQLEDLQKRIDESNQSMDELTSLQGEGVEDVENLMQPFREKLENAERERLYINENFEANQALTNELEGLLTEGNELIRQQKEITGLSAIRNPRIDKTISDVNSRAGVIQAVMSARNGQISQAYTMIDRSVNAINADKQDQLTYYSTLFTFYESQKDAEGNKLTTLTNEKKSFLGAQIGLLENDMAQAQNNANYIKDLMTDPDTALYMARAGVSLNDSPETVNQKMAQESQRQEVENFKTEKLDEGYTFVPYGNGNTTFSVGGKNLSFNAPPEKVPGGSGDDGDDGDDGDEIMSINKIEQFRRSYGWAPPFGYTRNQLLQYIKDNPTFTPEQLEEGAKQQAIENEKETETGTEEPTQTVEELIPNIMSSITDAQLKLLKTKADTAGISSMWKSKTTDVENYLNSIKADLQDAINFGYSLEETITTIINF